MPDSLRRGLTAMLTGAAASSYLRPVAAAAGLMSVAADACAARPADAGAAQFVQVKGREFALGGRRFVLRGANYLGSWRRNNDVAQGDGEKHVWWTFYGNWTPGDIDLDLRFLRSELNATVVRIACPSFGEAHAMTNVGGLPPWYAPDGSITAGYSAKLQQLADLALRNGIRVQFCLLWEFSKEALSNGEAFAPGADMDQIYARQVRSIASGLANHPGVMAYSIGNEVLVKFRVNGAHRSDYEPRAAGFILRRIRDIRQVAPRQLICSEEVISHRAGVWHWPSAEFAVMPDSDGSNGGRAFRLADIVDYLGPHFYPETFTPSDIGAGANAKLQDALQKLDAYLQVAAATGKPVVLNEFGLKLDPWTLPPALYGGFRDRLFQAVLSEGVKRGLQGILPWQPLPLLVMRPGHYAVTTDRSATGPNDVAVDTQDARGRPEHVLAVRPSHDLFTFAASGDTPQPTGAARAVAAAWPDVPPP